MTSKASWNSWLSRLVNGQRPPLVIVWLLLLITARIGAGQCTSQSTLLPTGVSISPAGTSIPVGNMPLNAIVSPDRQYLLLSLNGWDMQGIQVLRLATREIVQTLPLPGAFYGMSFSPDGKTLYVSGGNEDEIYRLSWDSGRIAQLGRIRLGNKDPDDKGTRFPAGLALSRDGRLLYVAELMADSVAVIDLRNDKILQRLQVEPYPNAVVLDRQNRMYVSSWGGSTISVFQAADDGLLSERRRITVGRHLSSLLLNRDQTRLFAASASTDAVFVVDTRTLSVAAVLKDPTPSSPGEGSTPNGLTLSSDGKLLYVSEADNNAVAVFQLSSRTRGIAGAPLHDRLMGRIPVGCIQLPSHFSLAHSGLSTAKGPQPTRIPMARFLEPRHFRTTGMSSAS